MKNKEINELLYRFFAFEGDVGLVGHARLRGRPRLKGAPRRGAGRGYAVDLLQQDEVSRLTDADREIFRRITTGDLADEFQAALDAEQPQHPSSWWRP